jgi:hypothetical protein
MKLQVKSRIWCVRHTAQFLDWTIRIWDWTIESNDWQLKDHPEQIIEFYQEEGYQFGVYDDNEHFHLNFQKDHRL